MNNAVAIIKILREAGHEAYFAGGCVRDKVLGVTPGDFDITTSARPDEVIGLFEKTIPVGEAFGVVVVVLGDAQYEVATFRSDGTYSDGRRPDSVVFSTKEEDVKRRDFTVNGMLYDPIGGDVIDLVGGMKDLRRGLIRAIGDPDARFAEDKLRMIRAARFAARFGFSIEPKTFDAMTAHRKEISSVSNERVREELIKIVTGRNPSLAMWILEDTGILQEILPEVSGLSGLSQPAEFHPEGDVFEHTMLVLENLPPRPSVELAMAALLHDVGKLVTMGTRNEVPTFHGHAEEGARLAVQICERLKFSRKEIDRISMMVGCHMKFGSTQEMKRAKLKRFLATPDFKELMALHLADRLSASRDLADYMFCQQAMFQFRNTADLSPEPLVNGQDLIGLGLKPGPAFKILLEHALDAQLEGVVCNKDQAVEFVRGLIEKFGAAENVPLAL